jgi:hypothetical protein
VASVSLDLDNVWSYLKIHGDPAWRSFPTYLDQVMDVVLEQLDRLRLRITFFIVGQDAALECNARAFEALAGAGHEVANHSYHHEPWLHLRSRAELDEEIRSAELAIESATGRRPRGFRGPGFSLSADTLAVLAERGYLYDASTFPTYIGPLARAYYFSHSTELTAEEREARAQLFGKFSEGFRPLKPYVWNAGGRELREIPVTTMPILKIPFHQSYLIYLAGISRPLAFTYLNLALTLCRATGTQPSFLLHPLDFLGGDRVKELAFFPGMSQTTAFKLQLFRDVMAVLSRYFRPITMEQHVELLQQTLPAAGPAAGRLYAS